MRLPLAILMIALSAAKVAALPSQPTVDELKARLPNAKPDERARLSLEIAERQVAAADRLYHDGKTEEAEAAIKDVVSYTDQAGQDMPSRHLKSAEISVRKMAHRLGDIKRTLAYDNQASVQSAIDALEKVRTRLLDRMFAKNKK